MRKCEILKQPKAHLSSFPTTCRRNFFIFLEVYAALTLTVDLAFLIIKVGAHAGQIIYLCTTRQLIKIFCILFLLINSPVDLNIITLATDKKIKLRKSLFTVFTTARRPTRCQHKISGGELKPREKSLGSL